MKAVPRYPASYEGEPPQQQYSGELISSLTNIVARAEQASDLKALLTQQRGSYIIIRTSGDEYTVNMKPTIRAVKDAIHASCLDSVCLSRKTQTVMLVDDTGMIDNKPVNEKATKLVRLAFGKDYPYSIHGDVAIVNDEDFA